MAKITKILAFTFAINLISLPLLTVHSKETGVQTGAPAGKPVRVTEKQDDLIGKPEVATEELNKASSVKTNQPIEQKPISTEQAGKKNHQSVENTAKGGEGPEVQGVEDTTKIEKLKMEKEEIGLYNYKFKLTVANDVTLPTSCTACVIPSQNSETCCEGHASKNICLEGTFDKLSAGTEYKLNICKSDKTELFSHTFKTKNIPRLKKSTFDNNDKIFTYELEYVQSDDVPTKCTAVTDNNKNVQCQDQTICSCTTGTYKLTEDVKKSVIRIVDPFDGILYHFNKDGPMPDDPSFYKFKVTNKLSDSVTYTMNKYDKDITDDSTCKFKDLADNAFLNCQKEDDTVTDECICKGGKLVGLSPFKKYDIEIKNKNDKFIYEKISFKTARILRELDHIIGLKKYKYTIKNGKGTDILSDPCKACLIDNIKSKKCCKEENSYTNKDYCSTREFDENEINKVSGNSLKINICDTQGNQIATDSFSMPIKFETAKFIQTINGFQYNLSFKDDKKPTICNLEIESKSTNQKIDHRCIDQGSSKCDCSSGEILLTPNLPGQITIIVKDYFDEKIVEESFTLEVSDKNHVTGPAKEPVESVEQPVKTPGDKPDVDSSLPGIKEDSGLPITNKPDGAGTEISEPVAEKDGEEEEENEEKKEAKEEAAKNKEPTEKNNANPGPADSQAATVGPTAPTRVGSELASGGGGSQSTGVTEQPVEEEEEEESEDDDDDTSDDQDNAIESGTSANSSVITKGDHGAEAPKDDQATNVKLPTPPIIVDGIPNSNNGGEKEEASQPNKDNAEADDDEVDVSVKKEFPTASVSPGVNNEPGGISKNDQATMNTPATPTGVSSEAAVEVDVSEPEVDDSSKDDDVDVDDNKKVLDEVIKVSEEAKEAADTARASAEEAKEAAKAVIEAEENSNPELIIPISIEEIDASTDTPVNTDDGQGSNGSISKDNDPIAIEPKPPIIPNSDGGITTGKGGDKAVNTINNGGSANGSTNDQDKANVPTSDGNDVPTVKPTTTASSDAPNPATNTTTNSVPSSDDAKKPGSDGGDINDQGLSSGAIIGIIVGVMVLAGSVGGISYYMIRIKGRASYV